MKAGTTRTDEVKALQCLLRERRYYGGSITGTFDAKLTAAVRAFQAAKRTPVSNTWRVENWTQLLANGRSRPAKYGTTGKFVARLQRALTSATGTALAADGAFFRSTENLVKKWQGQVGLAKTGVMSSKAWAMLKAGDR
ncbi:MAG: peptidoglycan-binding protein [Nocardioides sp.]